jgi:formylmethanofuran dehydrogenase subunit E
MVKIGRDDIGPGYYELKCDSCGALFFTNNPQMIDGTRMCPPCQHSVNDEPDGTGD